MKKHTTKRALLSSALSLLLCVAMLIGTTFAWFTDSVTSMNNVIKSGNLDIDVKYTLDGTTWADLGTAGNLFEDDLWEPGFTKVVALKITNKGSLALKYNASMNIVNETPGTNKAGETFNLSDILTVTTVANEANDIGDALLEMIFNGANAVDGNSVSFKDSSILAKDQVILANAAAQYVIVTVDMPETVGNEANHKGEGFEPSIEFGINVLATQYTYEEDSFDNQYDKDATYDEEASDEAIGIKTVEDLQDVLANNKHGKLLNNITLTAGNFTVAAGTKAVIDLNGNDLTVTNSDATPAFLMVDGDLTITGEGELDVIQINTREGSKLTLGKGVKISTSGSFAINNSGTTEINGATIEHTGTNHAIQNSGTLTINDATVTSTSTKDINTINSQGGTVTINGGTFTHNGSMGSVIQWLYSNEGEIIINGGTFIQNSGDSLASIDYGDAKLTINGGTFDSATYFAQPMENIVINAGEFKNNAVVVYNPFIRWTIEDKYIPATSTATTNADGSITVTKN